MLKFKKGLLYKYNTWCNGNLFTKDYVNKSKSICPYFWGSVWNVLFVNTLYLIIVTVAGLMISLLPVEGLGLFKEWVGEQGTLLYFVKSVFIGVTTFITFIGTVVSVVYVWIAFLLPTVSKLVRKYKTKGESAPKKPNLLVEWVKAKKNKVCPMIEWED
ncbi:conserved hypothetical protein [Vibrio phage 424E50-1]|nr:conserved hypothetical protein [Vibrio phage 424E50-1]